MRPERTGPLRRERRKAWRGIPGKRRAAHPVETTYGRHQKDRDERARFAEFWSQWRELTAVTAGKD